MLVDCLRLESEEGQSSRQTKTKPTLGCIEPASELINILAIVNFHLFLTTATSSLAVRCFAPWGTNMNSLMVEDLAAPVASSQILALHITISAGLATTEPSSPTRFMGGPGTNPSSSAAWFFGRGKVSGEWKRERVRCGWTFRTHKQESAANAEKNPGHGAEGTSPLDGPQAYVFHAVSRLKACFYQGIAVEPRRQRFTGTNTVGIRWD